MKAPDDIFNTRNNNEEQKEKCSAVAIRTANVLHGERALTTSAELLSHRLTAGM